jgi:4-amino-4-deoxy-L-arabinose transferase-like glycosyltransferase
MFMAGLYALAGERSWLIYGASALLGGVSCFFAYRIARRLMDERAARLAGLLCVIYLPHAYFAVMFWSENLFVPLFTAAVWLLLDVVLAMPPRKPMPTGSPVSPLSPLWRQGLYLILAGLLLGAAALTRPFALLAGPLFALVLIIHAGWRGLAASAVLGLATVLVVAPWTYRNSQVHQRFVLIATNGGSTFYGGNNDRVVQEWRNFGSWLSTVDLPGRAEIEAAPDEVSHDAVEWRLGREWVINNPGAALLSVPLKLGRLAVWLPDFDGGRSYYIVVRAVGYVPFLVLIGIGVWRGRRLMTGPGWWLLHVTVLATAVTAIIFWGSPRFRDANAPLLMVYAASAFARRGDPPVGNGLSESVS